MPVTFTGVIVRSHGVKVLVLVPHRVTEWWLAIPARKWFIFGYSTPRQSECEMSADQSPRFREAS